MTIQFGERTIFLDGALGARMPGRGIELSGLLNGEGIFVGRRTFATGRVRSQLFGGHGLMITRRASTSRQLSPPGHNGSTVNKKCVQIFSSFAWALRARPTSKGFF